MERTPVFTETYHAYLEQLKGVDLARLAGRLSYDSGHPGPVRARLPRTPAVRFRSDELPGICRCGAAGCLFRGKYQTAIETHFSGGLERSALSSCRAQHTVYHCGSLGCRVFRCNSTSTAATTSLEPPAPFSAVSRRSTISIWNAWRWAEHYWPSG